jgi:hypothetical protein
MPAGRAPAASTISSRICANRRGHGLGVAHALGTSRGTSGEGTPLVAKLHDQGCRSHQLRWCRFSLKSAYRHHPIIRPRRGLLAKYGTLPHPRARTRGPFSPVLGATGAAAPLARPGGLAGSRPSWGPRGREERLWTGWAVVLARVHRPWSALRSRLGGTPPRL